LFHRSRSDQSVGLRATRLSGITISQQLVRIEGNPNKPFTSAKRASEFVERGLAVRVSEFVIRFLSEPELWFGKRVEMQMARDAFFDKQIAQQRGGEDWACIWSGTKVAVPGAGNYADRACGYSVMGARVVAVHK
jgi:hypothetical protein